MLAFALVYGLAWRGGLSSDRLVLIGIGAWQGGMAVITYLVVAFDPWNTGKALTWLSGSTYGRMPTQVLPVLIALPGAHRRPWSPPAGNSTCWRWTTTPPACSASGWNAPG